MGAELRFQEIASAQRIVSKTSTNVFHTIHDESGDETKKLVNEITIFECRALLVQISEKKLKNLLEDFLENAETLSKKNFDESKQETFVSLISKIYEELNLEIQNNIKLVQDNVNKKLISVYNGEYIIQCLELIRETNLNLIKYFKSIKNRLDKVSEDIIKLTIGLFEYASGLGVLLTKEEFSGEKEFPEEFTEEINSYMASLNMFLLALKRQLGERPTRHKLTKAEEVILSGYPV